MKDLIIGIVSGFALGLAVGLAAKVGRSLGVDALLNRYSRRTERVMRKITDEQAELLVTTIEGTAASIQSAVEETLQTVVRESGEIQAALERANNQIPNFDLGPIIERLSAMGQGASQGLHSISSAVAELVNPPAPDPETPAEPETEVEGEGLPTDTEPTPEPTQDPDA